MNLTIRNAMTFGGLAGAKAVAGFDSLDNRIASISVLEVAESKIANWVVQDELYITAFYAIYEDVERQKEVIRALANCGCCGLVICHIGMWIKEMDERVIDLCNELHFPLIVAKAESSYVEILNPIIGILIQNKNDLRPSYGYSNIRNDFLELVLNEEDICQVFSKLAQKIKHKISCFDIYYACVYSDKRQEQVEEEISYIRENFSHINSQCTRNNYCLWQGPAFSKFIFLIKSQRSFFGFIVLDWQNDQEAAEILKLIEPLNVACTLLFSRKDTITGMKERYLQEYVGDLLVWNFSSTEDAVFRGKEVGIDITGKNHLVIANLNSFYQINNQNTGRDFANYVKKYLSPGITERIMFYNRRNVVIYRSDMFIILLEDCRQAMDLRKLGDSIVTLFKQQNIMTVSIGISDYFTDVKDIPNAYNQAFNGAILGRKLFGENHVATYLDVWFFYRLHSMADDPTAALMCQRLLEPLVQYDSLHKTNLVDTLRNLINHNMDTVLTADNMYLHRNTLLQRKNKIIELLGYSPFVMPYYANFVVAFGIID